MMYVYASCAVQYCYNVGNTTTCLFTKSDVVYSFDDAAQSCVSSVAQLAATSDNTSSQQLINYLNTTSLTQIWMPARETIDSNWTWINAKAYNGKYI